MAATIEGTNPPYDEPHKSGLENTLLIRLVWAKTIEHQIQRDTPGYKLTAMHAAIILCVLIDELGRGKLSALNVTGPFLKYRLDSFGALVKLYQKMSRVADLISLVSRKQDENMEYCLRDYLVALKSHGWMPVKDDDESDKRDKVVKLQFHWLDNQSREATKEIPLTSGNLSMKAMAQRQIQFEKDGHPSPFRYSNVDHSSAARGNVVTTILSGYVGEAELHLRDPEKFKAELEQKWIIARVAAMSGAAEIPDLLLIPELTV
ncbi:hypothetical protein ACHAPD_006544 [Fusarium lateritium]